MLKRTHLVASLALHVFAELSTAHPVPLFAENDPFSRNDLIFDHSMTLLLQVLGHVHAHTCLCLTSLALHVFLHV
jgi:hypothetical protein